MQEKIKRIVLSLNNRQKIKMILLNPYFLSAITLIIFTFIAFHFSRDYGITWDESDQNTYGLQVLQWYLTHGKDTTFLQQDILKHYGPFFEVIVAFFQTQYHHMWYVRTLINICAGLLGIVAIWLCGIEIKKPWVAFFALFFLILAPRYSGDIFANSKDIPFAAAYCFILWSVLHLVNNWNKKFILNSFFVAIFLGMASAIRIISVVWWVIFPIMIIFFWGRLLIQKSERSKLSKKFVIKEILKQIVSAFIIYAGSFLVMCQLWPYIYLSPVNNLIQTVTLMSHFTVSPQAVMQFNGKLVYELHPPRDYTIVWFFISTPLATIAFFILGFGSFLFDIIKNKSINKLLGIVALAALIPLTMIISLDSTLYNGPRQFIFILPPLIIFAAYGAYNLIEKFKNQKKILIITLIISIGYFGNVVWTETQLHPFEYTYFNESVGGLKGATGNYETEYWGASIKYCSLWLGNNYKTYTKQTYIPVDAPQFINKVQMLNFLPENFYESQNNAIFDVYLVRNLPSDFQPNVSKNKIIYTVKRFNIPLCNVVYNFHSS